MQKASILWKVRIMRSIEVFTAGRTKWAIRGRSRSESKVVTTLIRNGEISQKVLSQPVCQLKEQIWQKCEDIILFRQLSSIKVIQMVALSFSFSKNGKQTTYSDLSVENIYISSLQWYQPGRGWRFEFIRMFLELRHIKRSCVPCFDSSWGGGFGGPTLDFLIWTGEGHLVSIPAVRISSLEPVSVSQPSSAQPRGQGATRYTIWNSSSMLGKPI